ncbi:MAG TPA: hypothetical protein VG147_15090 [Solirubrobacteraceae bacterium]|nr:hypothetical protein [Solirubrobacteraceae bacterium]
MTLVLALAMLAVALIAPCIASAVGDATEQQCGVETEASPGYHTYLPDCRAYELVTPPYKEGGVVLDEPGAIAVDGSRVIVGAGGAFAGADNYWFALDRNPDAIAYELDRSAGGWQPSALVPPAEEYPYSTLMAVSANDGATLWGAQRTGGIFHEDIYLRTGGGASEFHRVGPATPSNEKGEALLAGYALSPSEELGFAGGSQDLSRSFFEIESSKEGVRKVHNGLNDLWTGDTTGPAGKSLYEYDYSGTEDREPTLVGVRNDGPLDGHSHVNEGAELISDCGTELGSGTSGSAYNAVSASGESVFFGALACAGGPPVNELYARIGGEHTVALSEPVLPGGAAGACATGEPCHGAEAKEGVFEGADEDGSRVFFLSAQPLVNGAPAEGMKLYEERLEGASVAEVIDIANVGVDAGIDPEVQGVVRVSENGERVYFVAKGKLTGGDRVAGREPEQGEPAPGADNLYVWEPEPAHPGTHRRVFVATLLTPGEEASLRAEETGEAEGIERQAHNTYASEETEIVHEFEAGEIGFEAARELLLDSELRAADFVEHALGTRGPFGTVNEDNSVWEVADHRPAQTTTDGGFLVFLSSGKLTPGDSSGVPQLFEFDAEDESLTRVSVGAEGPTSGNVDTFQDSPHIPAPQLGGVDLPTAADTGLAISEDGSRVFFTSAENLSPLAEEHATNVYEYSEGAVYLISGGSDTSLELRMPTVTLMGIDPSGRDVFFSTASQLVPQDASTQVALYDARAEGGFPAPVLASGCIGETCRGPAGGAPSSQSPGSSSATGGDNVPPSAMPPASPETGGPSKTGKGKQLKTAQRLTKALKRCESKRNKKQRTVCETQARRRYETKSTAGRASGKTARRAKAKDEGRR